MMKRMTNCGFAKTLCMTVFFSVCMFSGMSLRATDYFLTVGGGYNRTGNQASLEANVLFFRRVLSEKHHGEREHTVFFADGNDPAADLQVLAPRQGKSDTPATDLLMTLHRRSRGAPMRVAYRNHRVENIAGALDPDLIRKELESLATRAGGNDRLIIFVTAHGSGGKKEEPYNTSLDCWGNRKISAREFAGWLDKLPADLPVVMVMAQCFCGGFSHTMFKELDVTQGLSPQLRAGFFAQQHDLPAAGCRPDIEHDEEFSSYFWGAILGKTRNGKTITGCDADGDGKISFAEAYAHAVIAGDTIDIPLRTSEVFLRTYSRLKSDKDKEADEPATESASGEEITGEDAARTELTTLDAKLDELLTDARPVDRRIITELAKSLDVSTQSRASDVLDRYEELRRNGRGAGRGRMRQSSGRRELLQELSDKWPELGDPDKWRDSPLLGKESQQELFVEIQKLNNWKLYVERRKQSAETDQVYDERELRTVKFRRLVHAIETLVLQRNLSKVASAELNQRFLKLIELEESSLHLH